MLTSINNVLLQMNVRKRRSLPFRIEARYLRRIKPRKVSHLMCPRDTNIEVPEIEIFCDAAIETFVCEAREFFF